MAMTMVTMIAAASALFYCIAASTALQSSSTVADDPWAADLAAAAASSPLNRGTDFPDPVVADDDDQTFPPCDDDDEEDSFPFAPASFQQVLLPITSSDDALNDEDDEQSHHRQRRRTRRLMMVSLPDDPTRRTYAPLCRSSTSNKNSLRINTRHLKSCNPGQCFVPAYQQCFHSTSYECLNDIPLATSTPTTRPTHPTINTIHRVKLVLKNVPRGFKVGVEVRSMILRFVSELLREELGRVGLELVDVEFAGRLKQYNNNNKSSQSNSSGSGEARRHLRAASSSSTNNEVHGEIKGKELQEDESKGKYASKNTQRQLLRQPQQPQQQQQRRLESIGIPLRITVSGPTDISDFALSYLMEILRANFGKLILQLQQNAGEIQGDGSGLGEEENGSGGGESLASIFANMDLGADTFDQSDIVTGATMAPIGAVTNEPTSRPTSQPVVVEVLETTPIDPPIVVDDSNKATPVIVLEEPPSVTIPWWVWLLIVLILLLCIICGCCYCVRRRRRSSDRKEKKTQQAINIWMKRPSVGDNADDDSDSEDLKRNQHNNKRSARPVRNSGRPRQVHRRPRNIPVQDSHNANTKPRRASRPRRPPPPQHSIKRSICRTELEEEERQHMLFDDVDTQASDDGEVGPIIPFGNNDPDMRDVVSAISMDPPEEHAMVPYSHRHHLEGGGSRDENVDGSNRSGSRMADMYYGGAGGGNGIGSSNRSGVTSREPDGAKVPKQTSMYAEEAVVLYHSAPVVSHGSGNSGGNNNNNNNGNGRARRPRKREPNGARRTPKKDSMFVCPIDELPEEVRNRTSKAVAADAEGRHTSHAAEGAERGDGRRKKKSSSSSKRKKRRNPAVESLKVSLTKARPLLPPLPTSDGDDDTPQDVFVENDKHLRFSVITMQKELTKGEEEMYASKKPNDDIADEKVEDMALVPVGDNGRSRERNDDVASLASDDSPSLMTHPREQPNNEEGRPSNRGSSGVEDSIEHSVPKTKKKKRKSKKKKNKESAGEGGGNKKSESNNAFSTFTRRLSWNNKGAAYSDDDDSNGGGSVSIGLNEGV